MSKPKMYMNEEIKKFDIFFLHDNGKLEQIYYIQSIDDYNHFELELHHRVPYTDWVMNTKNVQSLTDECLILMRKKTHQHLENPEYRLPRDKFIELYHIAPEELLFDVNKRNNQYLKPFKNNQESAYDGCFDDVDFGVEKQKSDDGGSV